jgi:hypothetical protein
MVVLTLFADFRQNRESEVGEKNGLEREECGQE